MRRVPSQGNPVDAPSHNDLDDQPADEFLRQVRRTARSVLGDSEIGRQVQELCDEHAQARQLISQDRSAGSLVLAIVGATGQGKSWLVRQIVRRSAAADSIRSGTRADQATEQLVWVGPRPPADLDPRFEQFVRVAAEDMEPLGVPYVLVDAPGSTDDRRGIAEVAQRALSLASALVLVVRRDQIRAYTPGALASASEGSIVIPVINTVGREDDALQGDVDVFLSNLRSAAPGSIVARPVQIDDFEATGRDAQEVGSEAVQEVFRRLKLELENNPDSDRRKSTRLKALDGRFRAALCALLADQLPGLTRAVNRLNDAATRLPGEVAQTLIGPEGPLQAAVRSRLRLRLLTETGAIWFPYRSLLGLLNLTHGAWDRVVLSLSGSLPSLVSAIWTSTRSLTSDRSANDEMRDGLRKRAAAAVTDRLGPLAAQFRDELMLLRSGTANIPGDDRSDLSTAAMRRDQDAYHVASLGGLDALQERSQNILQTTIDRNAVGPGAATVMALLGTAIFWILMAGPFVAIYSEYLVASYEALAGGRMTMEHFPKPEFATVLTSLLLSVFPTAVFAMIALSVAQSRRRVRAAEQAIREQHEQAIDDLQRDRVLRLQWDDPLLSDAEFLVSAGAGGHPE
ncbi:GTPase domain-containing protein [Roseiconus nitratireducens]|uniref:GTPase domain-containing protein n=1 Tax=Roseiconus nitratireducens TaxID=2605748 RepID=A0A5M6DCG4_9BACT|nr:GTPase domain-containing protein [Roseiconus nitratireducens]KAA5545251.1 GTPase domain-containing protein [Roseiconus nitratireducens]